MPHVHKPKTTETPPPKPKKVRDAGPDAMANPPRKWNAPTKRQTSFPQATRRRSIDEG
jgi:hypothetical protein